MTQLSSSSTWFHKKLFPALWFGFLGLFMYLGVSQADEVGAPFVIMPFAMAIVGVVVMKRLVWDLADEVHDYGHSLLVKKGDDEEFVPLTNIMNVSVSHTRPLRITLRLAHPGKFGNEITFTPVTEFTLNPFAKNAVAEQLILRTHQARIGKSG